MKRRRLRTQERHCPAEVAGIADAGRRVSELLDPVGEVHAGQRRVDGDALVGDVARRRLGPRPQPGAGQVRQ